MGLFTKRNELQDIENVFMQLATEQNYSKNEIAVYLYLLHKCNPDTLKTNCSLDTLSTELKIAVNTVKSCRDGLHDYNLLTYEKYENTPTTYFIRDLVKDPITNTEPADQDQIWDVQNVDDYKVLNESSNETKTEHSKTASFLDIDLSFVEPDLLPAYKTLIYNKSKHKIPYSQESTLELYSRISSSISIDEHKKMIFNMISSIIEGNVFSVLDDYDLSFVEDELYEVFTKHIIDEIAFGNTFSQSQLIDMYSEALANSFGDIEEFEKKLK
ncbi:MAG: hypothetical protein JXR36_14020 [Bacteroidales bacterium]|nr:hypothetical protein [Bacteroidales bacterium]